MVTFVSVTVLSFDISHILRGLCTALMLITDLYPFLGVCGMNCRDISVRKVTEPYKLHEVTKDGNRNAFANPCANT